MSELEEHPLAEWTHAAPCEVCGGVVRVRRVLEIRSASLTLVHIVSCPECPHARVTLAEQSRPPF